MNVTEANLSIPDDVMTDAQTVADCVALGRPVPSEVAQRVRDRAEHIRRAVAAQHGILDIGVPAIREFRGELPLP
jgi:hypothetical protein